MINGIFSFFKLVDFREKLINLHIGFIFLKAFIEFLQLIYFCHQEVNIIIKLISHILNFLFHIHSVIIDFSLLCCNPIGEGV